MKTCSKCREVAPLDRFSKNRCAKDGLQALCKLCHYASVKATREKNPDVRKANRALHIAKELEKNRAYKAANKPKIRLQSKIDAAVRRNRLLNAPGSFTKQDVLTLFQMQKGKCPVCRCQLGEKYHVDHVQPLARGGSNDKENLQLLCAPCNRSKNAKDPLVFMQARGYLL